jgi:hypothetical protein
MLFREIIAVYSENCMRLINTLFGRYAKILKVKADGTYSYHCGLKCYACLTQYPVVEVLVFCRLNKDRSSQET